MNAPTKPLFQSRSIAARTSPQLVTMGLCVPFFSLSWRTLKNSAPFSFVHPAFASRSFVSPAGTLGALSEVLYHFTTRLSMSFRFPSTPVSAVWRHPRDPD